MADIEQHERELMDLKRVKREKDQIVSELDRSLRSFESRKRHLRIEKQRLDDQIEKLVNQLEENVADSRLGTYETQLEVRANSSYEENG